MRAGFRPRTVLVTGGAGFIGSNLIRWLLRHDPDLRVVNFDALTYAGNLESLEDVEASHGSAGDGRYRLVHGHIRDFEAVAAALRGEAGGGLPGWPVDAVLHLAAESHVDRSILGPAVFIETNVRGTLVLLEASPRHVPLQELAGAIGAVAGVADVHDLHVWTVSNGIVAMSAHATVPDPGRHQAALEEICRMVRTFGIQHVTIQMERETAWHE